VSPPADFESATSTNSITPASFFIILHAVPNFKSLFHFSLKITRAIPGAENPRTSRRIRLNISWEIPWFQALSLLAGLTKKSADDILAK
jgi:hypothetical protein